MYSCPVRILKCARNSVPLSEIFNISIEIGKYSQKLKLTKIVPFFKSGDETDQTNYRPIKKEIISVL